MTSLFHPEPKADMATEDSLQAEASLLDLVDNLLNKGVVIEGEVVLGLAGIDLIYLRLSALLCAADRVWEDVSAQAQAQAQATLGLSRGK